MSAHILAEYQQPLIPTKLCPDCKDPHAEFGRDRSRHDGLHQRCKRCNREKMQAIRSREYALRGEVVVIPKPEVPKFSRAELVKRSLAGGPLTFDGLAKATKLTEDTLCNVLATLMLHKRQVESWSVEIESEDEFDFTRWYRLV